MSDYFFLDRAPPDRFTIGLPVQNTIFLKWDSVGDSTVVCNSETCSNTVVSLIGLMSLRCTVTEDATGLLGDGGGW